MHRAPDRDGNVAVVVHEFLARLFADREAGEEHPLEDYKARFPGHEERIAQEYAAFAPAGDAGRGDGGPASGPSQPGRLGRFRIVRELGRGGQGVVYLAEDSELRREVALKVLALPVGLAPDALERFRREAESASRLDHPGICTVYEAGAVEGAPYIAMRYVRGETLREKLAAARAARRSGGTPALTALSGRPDGASDSGWTSTVPESRAHVLRVVRLVEEVARALHHAHERGLVHRDVKPGNVLVAEDGTPVVLDFGLVRDPAADAEGLTASGDLLGTPAYLSPEQLQGSAVALDRRTDVYSLGVTLYECLALERPFEAPTRDALYRRILGDAPPDVRARNRHVPAELKVVLETALEKDRDRRYRTALELAEDLRRVRERQPIQARPPALGLRARRWVQRNPAPSIALAVLGLGLVVAGVLLRQRNVALEELRAVVLADAALEVQERNGLLALQLACEAVRVDRTAHTLSTLHAALATANERARFEKHEAFVYHVAFSPDGDSLLTTSADNLAPRLWNLAGEELATFQPAGRAAFSPDGERVLTASDTAHVWSRDGTHLGQLPGDAQVRGAAFSPGGRWIVTTSRDGTARVWDGEGPWAGPVQVLAGHTAQVLDGRFSADEQRLVTASEDRTAVVWQRAGAGWERLSTLGGPDGHTGQVWGASFAPGGELVLTFSSNGLGLTRTSDFTARLWNATGELLEVLEHEGILLSAEFSPSGDAVLTAAEDGLVKLWALDEEGRVAERRPLLADPAAGSLSARFSPAGDRVLVTGGNGFARVVDRSGRRVAELRGHSSFVLDGAFSPDGALVATAGFDRTARIWELSDPELPAWSPGGRVTRMDLCGRRVATISQDGELRLWDRDGSLLWERSHPSPDRKHCAVAFAPGGDRVVTASYSGRVVVWDAEGEKHVELAVPEDALTASVALSPADGSILVGSHDRARLFAADGSPLRSFRGTAMHVEFSPSGDRILTAARNGGARVFPCDDGELLAELPHGFEVRHATFSPDGRRVLTACADDRGYLWDLESAERDAEGRRVPERVLEGHEGALQTGAFSPDGTLVATGSSDGTARLWRIDGTPVAVLPGHLAGVKSIDFTPDGRRLLTACWSGTVRTWAVDPDELVALAERRLAGRTMTAEEERRYAEHLGR